MWIASYRSINDSIRITEPVSLLISPNAIFLTKLKDRINIDLTLYMPWPRKVKKKEKIGKTKK